MCHLKLQVFVLLAFNYQKLDSTKSGEEEFSSLAFVPANETEMHVGDVYLKLIFPCLLNHLIVFDDKNVIGHLVFAPLSEQ